MILYYSLIGQTDIHRLQQHLCSAAAAAAKLLQSCPTLCDPIDGSPPGSAVWDSPGKNTGVGCHFLLLCMKVKSEREVAQSCLTLSDSMDCSLPGSSVHGIFQARVLTRPHKDSQIPPLSLSLIITHSQGYLVLFIPHLYTQQHLQQKFPRSFCCLVHFAHSIFLKFPLVFTTLWVSLYYRCQNNHIHCHLTAQ